MSVWTMGSPISISSAGDSSATVLLSLTDLASYGFVDALAWIAIGAFVLGMILEWHQSIDGARYISAAGWALFGVFWVLMAPYYYSDVQSPLQTILSLAALPLCLYAGYLLVQGRQSLLVLSRAVAFMGLIYLPAETIPIFRQWLIETTAAQTHFAMDLVADGPGINEGTNGYHSRFNFDSDKTATGVTTYIVLACTGLGSMAIFGGLIASVKAPLKRKFTAFAVTVTIIWFLNLARTVFIALATPHGWFQYGPVVSVETEYLGMAPEWISYHVAHTYISQPLSIIALIGIAFVVIKMMPEVVEPLEEVLYILTGNEYDLAKALNMDVESDTGARSAVTDGGGQG